MGLRRLQGAEQLRQIQTILRIARNEDAGEAFRESVGLLMSSRNGELFQTVQNSLFFKLGKLMHSDLTTPVEETGEFMAALACFSHKKVEDALAAHYGQFQERENMVQWFMHTIPRILVIHLARVVFGSEGAFKNCAPVTFRHFLILEGYTCLSHGGLWSELTGIMAHIGAMNHGHYMTFCRIRGKWCKFDDAVVTKVSTIAVSEENFPVPSLSQTAHNLVYTLA
jgi:hypothetical protein